MVLVLHWFCHVTLNLSFCHFSNGRVWSGLPPNNVILFGEQLAPVQCSQWYLGSPRPSCHGGLLSCAYGEPEGGFGWGCAQGRVCRMDDQVMGISLLEASEFSARSPEFFLQIHLHKAVWEVSPMQEDVTNLQFFLVLRFLWNKPRLAELEEILLALTSLKLVIVNVGWIFMVMRVLEEDKVLPGSLFLEGLLWNLVSFCDKPGMSDKEGEYTIWCLLSNLAERLCKARRC